MTKSEIEALIRKAHSASQKAQSSGDVAGAEKHKAVVKRLFAALDNNEYSDATPADAPAQEAPRLAGEAAQQPAPPPPNPAPAPNPVDDFAARQAAPEPVPAPTKPDTSGFAGRDWLEHGITGLARAVPVAGPVLSKLTGGYLDEKRAEREAYAEELRQTNPELAELVANPEIPVRPFGIDTGATYPNSLGSFLAGTGKGMTDIGRAVGVAEMSPEQRARDAALIKTSLPAAIGEVVGQSAPAAPFGVMAGAGRTVAGRAVGQGLVSGAEGAAIAEAEGGNAADILGGFALGAGLGSAGEAVAPLVSKAKQALGFDDLTKAAKRVVNDAGEIDENAFAAATEGLVPKDVIALRHRADREAVFKRHGIQITEAQRTRDPELFRKQNEKVGKDQNLVRQVVMEQDARMNDILAEKISQIGDPAKAADGVVGAVQKKSKQFEDDISALYKAADEAVTGEKVIKFNEAAKALRAAKHEFGISGFGAALTGRMRDMGLINDAYQPTGRIAPKQAEQLRQYANELYKDADGRGRAIIRSFKDALDKDVLSATGDDLYRSASDLHRQYKKGLSHERISKWDEYEKSLPAAILENRIAPEKISSGAIFGKDSGYRASDFAELKSYLHNGTQAQVAEGAEAWNNLRAAALNSMVEKAFKRGATDEAGQSVFSPVAWRAAKDAIGADKLRILFGADEMRLIDDMMKIGTEKQAPRMIGRAEAPGLVREAKAAIANLPGIKTVVDHFGDRLSERQLIKIGTIAKDIQKKQQAEITKRLRRSAAAEAAALSAPVATAAAVGGEDE